MIVFDILAGQAHHGLRLRFELPRTLPLPGAHLLAWFRLDTCPFVASQKSGVDGC